MKPSTWNPGIGIAPPVEGAHETFTKPPGGTLPGPGVKTPGNPFRVQPVAPIAVPPEFTSVMVHVPLLAIHATKLAVTFAGV